MNKTHNKQYFDSTIGAKNYIVDKCPTMSKDDEGSKAEGSRLYKETGSGGMERDK